MTSNVRAHRIDHVIPADVWANSDAVRTVTALVATFPDAEEIAGALGLEVGA